MWLYDLEQSYNSIKRHLLLSLLITMSLTIGLIFPAVNLAVFAGAYDQMQGSFLQGEHLYQNHFTPRIDYAHADQVAQMIAKIPGVEKAVLESNSVLPISSETALVNGPIALETRDSLSLKGVPAEEIGDLFTKPNQMLLTSNMAEALFPPAVDPVGKTLRIAGVDFTVAGVLKGGQRTVYSSIDAANGMIGNQKPLVQTITVQLGEANPDALGEASRIMTEQGYRANFEDYTDYTENQMSGYYRDFLFSLGMCLLLLIFTLLNTVSLLVYKYEKDRQKWAIAYTFGATNRNLRRQVYTESLLYSVVALVLLFPGAAVVKQIVEQFELNTVFSPLVYGGLFAAGVLTSLFLAWMSLRRIGKGNLLQELRG